MSQSSESPGMQQQAVSAASQQMPWRKDVAWWVILIQAIILTVLGLFVLTQGESASNIVVLAAGVLLLVDGAMAGVGAMRGRHAGSAGTLNAINAGIALIVGVLVILGRLLDFLDIPTAALIAAIGLIVSGGISLVIALFLRGPEEKLRLTRVIGPLVWIGLGVLVLLTRDGTVDTMRIIGLVSLGLGIILFVLTFFRFRASRVPAAATEAPSA